MYGHLLERTCSTVLKVSRGFELGNETTASFTSSLPQTLLKQIFIMFAISCFQVKK